MSFHKVSGFLNSVVDWAAEGFFWALDKTALAVSMGFMTCGLWKMATGLFILAGTFLPSWSYVLWGWAAPDAGHYELSDLLHAAVDQALRGLELSFFAPMPYSLVNAVSLRLVEIGKRQTLSRSDASGRQAATEETGEMEIIGAKAITLQLMAAIVATDLVDRATSKVGLTWESSMCEILLILTLVSSSLVIRRHSLSKP